jgi:hypothetical protein
VIAAILWLAALVGSVWALERLRKRRSELMTKRRWR